MALQSGKRGGKAFALESATGKGEIPAFSLDRRMFIRFKQNKTKVNFCMNFILAFYRRNRNGKEKLF